MSSNIKIKNVALVTAGLFLIIYSLIQFSVDIEYQDILSGVLKSGFAFTIVTFFWIWYEKIGWKIKKVGFKCIANIPDLNGRYVGFVQRNTNDEPHKFVIEIVQTATNISYKTYSSSSNGESILIILKLNEDNENVINLYSYWWTQTKNRKNQALVEKFDGFSRWQISRPNLNSKVDMRIDDSYFTDRSVQTKGKVSAVWQTDKLNNNYMD
jgi:hypothetical protein